MLRTIWRRITGADVKFLGWKLSQSENQFNDLTIVLDRTKRENALLKDSLEKVVAREKELRTQSEDRGHNLVKWESKNQHLTEQLESIRSENVKLRNGIGHLLHGMAAVQDVANAFVKRIDMIPNFFGLGEPLAKEILDEFAKSNKPKEEEPKRIIPLSTVLTRTSYTLEVETDNNCSLTSTIDPRDVVTLIRKTAGLYGYEVFNLDNVDREFIEDISTCGLYYLSVGLNDDRYKLKLWVVPKGSLQEEPQEEPPKPQEEPPKHDDEYDDLDDLDDLDDDEYDDDDDWPYDDEYDDDDDYDDNWPDDDDDNEYD